MDTLIEGSDEITRLDGTPYTGVAYEGAADGRPVSEIEFVDGLQHGTARDWDANGRLRGTSTYFKGVRHGKEEEWFESGAPSLKALYEYDILVEKSVWDESGNLVEAYRLTEQDPLFATLIVLREAHGSPKQI